MTRKETAMKFYVCTVGLATLLAVQGQVRGQSVDARAAFAARVAAYAAMHHELRLDIEATPSDRPYAWLTDRSKLRAAIRRARIHACEGDMFGTLAAVLRRDLWWTLRQFGIEPRDLIADTLADTEAGARPPVVNEPFSWALGNAMPPALLAVLPPLPAGLEYRFVGADLVLIDIDADLVVDILRRALVDTSFAQHTVGVGRVAG
jgi:hypothetical protein